MDFTFVPVCINTHSHAAALGTRQVALHQSSTTAMCSSPFSYLLFN